MPRQKNDGRGRLGGREKGTPNNNNPIKEYLRTHSQKYFRPKPQINPDGTPRIIPIRNREGEIIHELPLADSEGQPLVMSDFDLDIIQLEARDRVAAELRLLKFTTPEMKSVDVDLTATTTRTIEDILTDLCQDPTDPR